ncbi:MAG: hypothetical protein JSW52_05655 [Candidatus Coatesbacteria bacterium]|nr:MAG: hypothetical protein JSW52_05655 [Candidatus Coatesbacteria bacterium]
MTAKTDLNQEVLLRNRMLFAKIRDNEFNRGAGLLVKILARYENGAENDLDRFMKELDDMVSVFERARYCARMSVGGNNVNPPDDITYQERAFVDHVETMYSFARSIRRMLRHEIHVRDFLDAQTDLDANMSDYARTIQRTEANMVLGSLRTMSERIDLYKGFFGDTGNG